MYKLYEFYIQALNQVRSSKLSEVAQRIQKLAMNLSSTYCGKYTDSLGRYIFSKQTYDIVIQFTHLESPPLLSPFYLLRDWQRAGKTVCFADRGKQKIRLPNSVNRFSPKRPLSQSCQSIRRSSTALSAKDASSSGKYFLMAWCRASKFSSKPKTK